jgi:hypothetical protein
MLAWTAQAICYGFAGALLLMLVRVWWSTLRFFGGFPGGAVWQMLRFARHSRNWYRETVAALAAPVLAACIWLPMGSRLPGPMIAFLVATCAQSLFLVTRSLQPPVALFLAGSSPGAADLLMTINSVLWPLRCVALLDPARMHFMQRNALGDNLRTSDPQLWKSIVHRLIETTPIMVVDARGEHGGVMQETFIVLAPEYAARTAFITTSDRRAPALEAHGVHPLRHALTCVTEDELIPLLWDWTRSPRSLPQPMEVRRFRSAALQAERVESLPSILAVVLFPVFDSRSVVRRAAESGQQLLQLLTPLSRMEPHDVEWSLECSWEFLHDPGLVVMIFEESHRAFVRISFLREVEEQMQPRVVPALVPPLSFAELVQPEPIWSAVWDFLMELARYAKESGRTVRFVRH